MGSGVCADVVDIIRYNAPRSGHTRRHRSWLPLARTQSARHKLHKFLREAEASGAQEPSDENGAECHGANVVCGTNAWVCSVLLVCGC
jgi:hypothetical protein